MAFNGPITNRRHSNLNNINTAINHAQSAVIASQVDKFLSDGGKIDVSESICAGVNSQRCGHDGDVTVRI